jgi:hypothetical protein
MIAPVHWQGTESTGCTSLPTQSPPIWTRAMATTARSTPTRPTLAPSPSPSPESAASATGLQHSQHVRVPLPYVDWLPVHDRLLRPRRYVRRLHETHTGQRRLRQQRFVQELHPLVHLFRRPRVHRRLLPVQTYRLRRPGQIQIHPGRNGSLQQLEWCQMLALVRRVERVHRQQLLES